MSLDMNALAAGLFGTGSREEAKKVVDGIVRSNEVVQLPLDEVRGYAKHTFKVVKKPEERWKSFVESIRELGVQTPILVRNNPNGETKYECISGHRRIEGSKDAGRTTIPAVVLELSDDEADLLMVISNDQRDRWLPSEKARSWKREYEVLKHQGQRTDIDGTKEEDEQKGKKHKSPAERRLEALSGQSLRTVQRYIRLCDLSDVLLDMLDDKKIPFRAAYEATSLSPEGQNIMITLVNDHHALGAEEVRHFADMEKEGALTLQDALDYLNRKEPGKELRFSSSQIKTLDSYFPEDFGTTEEKEALIEQLLQEHFSS